MSMSEPQQCAKIHICTPTSIDRPAHWIHVLDVPIRDIPRFVTHSNPIHAVKYLKYLAYCLTGSDGCLSRDSHSRTEIGQEELESEQVAASLTEEQVLAGYFYFYPDTDAYTLADPDEAFAQSSSRPSDSCSSSSFDGSSSSSIRILRDNLTALGYKACLFTGDRARDCHACHLVPRRKGAVYLKRLLKARGAHSPVDGPEEDVDGLDVAMDDYRNMILLSRALRWCLDMRDLAFLKTPNPVFRDASEVGVMAPAPALANANANANNNVATATFQTDADAHALTLTVHLFREVPSIEMWHRKSSSLLHVDEASRPFEVLYPVLYASAALKRWGVESAIMEMRALVKDVYYPDVDEEVRRKEEESQRRKQRRDKRRAARACASRRKDADDLLDVVLFLRGASQVKTEDRAKRNDDDDDARKRVLEERVESWRAQTSGELEADVCTPEHE